MSRRIRSLARDIVEDFRYGLSILGLARKYGRTVKQIEDVLRKAL